MSKMGDLSQILDELIDCGNKLTATAQALRKFYSAPDATEEETAAPAKEEAPEKTPATTEISMEELRERLAKKAEEEDGRFKVQVKELVKKYADGGTLRKIPTDKYADVIAELEVMN